VDYRRSAPRGCNSAIDTVAFDKERAAPRQQSGPDNYRSVTYPSNGGLTRAATGKTLSERGILLRSASCEYQSRLDHARIADRSSPIELHRTRERSTARREHRALIIYHSLRECRFLFRNRSLRDNRRETALAHRGTSEHRPVPLRDRFSPFRCLATIILTSLNRSRLTTLSAERVSVALRDRSSKQFRPRCVPGLRVTTPF